MFKLHDEAGAQALGTRSRPGTSGTDDASPKARSTMVVLLIEDDTTFAKLTTASLHRAPGALVAVARVASLGEARNWLKSSRADVAVLDLNLSDSAGLETVLRFRAEFPHLPVVVLTGLDDEDLGVDILKAGAQDYVVKGCDPVLVNRAVLYAFERSQSEARLRAAELELRDAQLQLIQSEKLESVGCLAAGFAHEIKNPLAVLQMGLELLARRKDRLDEGAREALQMMDKAVERASSIVQRLLTFASPAGGERRLTSLNNLIEQAREMIQHETNRREVRIEEELAPDLPLLLLDATSIQQALINLLTNAVQASPRGTAVRIRTRQLMLSRPGGDVGRRATDRFPVGTVTVQCEILDEGPGLTQEIQRRLFQPFFTTKQQGEGTGLGLYVTRNIIEMHGGKLELNNRQGGGTRALITLVP